MYINLEDARAEKETVMVLSTAKVLSTAEAHHTSVLITLMILDTEVSETAAVAS